MDILTPTLQQNPVFGNVSSSASSTFLKWQYGAYKGIEWFSKDVIPVVFSQNAWEVIKALLSVFSIFCITVMVYTAVRMFEIRKKEHDHLHEEIAEYAHKMAEKEKERKKKEQISTNPDWINVINHLSSSNQEEWKLAIVDADVMLLKLLTQLGFQGEGIGEKLKSADPERFKSLSIAWEAHSVRNKIVHEGPRFVLSSREVNRVISLYEQIFQEFGFI